MCVEEILKDISNEGEIWKPCPEFESKYLISSQGRILGIGIYNTCKKGELIKQHQKRGRNSYMQVRLYDNGRAKTMEVHTLVAKAFVPNPYNLPIVNHINENKIDNRVENLEWCTNAYNIRYSDTKAVDVYSKDGEFIETLDAISDVAAKYNTNTSNVSRCCKSKYRIVKGFCFRYHGEPYNRKPLSIKRRSKNTNKCLSVNEYTVEGEFVKTWNSISLVAKEYNTSTSNICKCTKGTILTYKGRIFLKDTNITERLILISKRKHISKTENGKLS